MSTVQINLRDLNFALFATVHIPPYSPHSLYANEPK